MRSSLTMLALAGSLGLLMCGDGLAQRGGSRGGHSGPHTGSNGVYNSGYNNYGGYRGNYNNGITYGVGIGFGNQGRYYNSYRSYSPYSQSYISPSQGTTYYSTPSTVYVQSSPVYDTSIVQAASTTGKAIIDVIVPTADSKVMFGTTVMDLQGKERRYESTEINIGQNYTYTITASWMKDGKPMEQVLKVDIMAGRTSKATFSNADASQKLPAPEPTREK